MWHAWEKRDIHTAFSVRKPEGKRPFEWLDIDLI